jgi:hypothetical protein
LVPAPNAGADADFPPHATTRKSTEERIARS